MLVDRFQFHRILWLVEASKERRALGWTFNAYGLESFFWGEENEKPSSNFKISVILSIEHMRFQGVNMQEV